MAELNRKALRKIFEDAGMDIPPKDVLGQICDLHTEALDGMNDTIKDLNKKLSEAKNADDGYKTKYEKEHEAFEAYKSEQSAKETKAAKSKAYREMLREIGIDEKRLDAVMKASAPSVDGIELDSDGKIKDAAKHKTAAKTEWADFIVSTNTKGANTANPPANGGKTTMTRADIYKTDEHGRFVMNASERQEALSQLLIAEQQKG